MVNVSLPFFFVRRSQMIAGMMPTKNAACTRYAAARTLFTVVAAGGLARDGDLRHAAGKDFFYCCDLSHAVSFCELA